MSLVLRLPLTGVYMGIGQTTPCRKDPYILCGYNLTVAVEINKIQGGCFGCLFLARSSPPPPPIAALGLKFCVHKILKSKPCPKNKLPSAAPTAMNYCTCYFTQLYIMIYVMNGALEQTKYTRIKKKNQCFSSDFCYCYKAMY